MDPRLASAAAAPKQRDGIEPLDALQPNRNEPKIQQRPDGIYYGLPNGLNIEDVFEMDRLNKEKEERMYRAVVPKIHETPEIANYIRNVAETAPAMLVQMATAPTDKAGAEIAETLHKVLEFLFAQLLYGHTECKKIRVDMLDLLETRAKICGVIVETLLQQWPQKISLPGTLPPDPQYRYPMLRVIMNEYMRVAQECVLTCARVRSELATVSFTAGLAQDEDSSSSKEDH